MHGQFLIVDRENTNSVNLAEKTSILQDWLKKHHSANSVQKNVFKLNKMLCFLRKKKCPFAAVCDFPTIILYISERLMCLQLRMFVHFFFNPLVCVLQSVSFLWLYICLCFFVCLFVVASPANKWCELCLVSCLFRFHVSHSLSLWREGWRWLGSTWNLQSLEKSPTQSFQIMLENYFNKDNLLKLLTFIVCAVDLFNCFRCWHIRLSLALGHSSCFFVPFSFSLLE